MWGREARSRGAADPEPLATLFPGAVTTAFVRFRVGSSAHLAQLPPVLSLVRNYIPSAGKHCQFCQYTVVAAVARLAGWERASNDRVPVQE